MKKNKTVVKKQEPQEEMDKCVMCGEPTHYPVKMHIDYRMHYVEGAGQLCEDCYNKVYNGKSTKK